MIKKQVFFVRTIIQKAFFVRTINRYFRLFLFFVRTINRQFLRQNDNKNGCFRGIFINYSLMEMEVF